MNKLILTKEELMRAAKVKYVCTDGTIFMDNVEAVEEAGDEIKLRCCSRDDEGVLCGSYFVWFTPIDDEAYECTHTKIEVVYVEDTSIGSLTTPILKAIERKEVEELEDNEINDEDTESTSTDPDFEPVESILIDVYNMLYVNKLDTDEVRKYLDFIDGRN